MSCLPFDILQKNLRRNPAGQIITSLPETDHPLLFSSLPEVLERLCLAVGPDLNVLASVAEANTILALAGWRKAKQIYRFDPEFWTLLTKQTDFDAKIPIQILGQIPYKTIWIDNLNAFLYFDSSYGDDVVDLKLLLYNDAGKQIGMKSLELIQGKTFRECISKTIDNSIPHAVVDDPILRNQLLHHSSHDEVWDDIAAALQAVLYLCAQNSDIQENPAQRKIYKKPANRNKDKFTDIRKWDVGTVVIRELNSSRKTEPKSRSSRPDSSSGWTQRPHVRRAHWHHFWKGSGDQRTLILKWIPPLIINAEAGDVHTTINVINKEQETK